MDDSPTMVLSFVGCYGSIDETVRRRVSCVKCCPVLPVLFFSSNKHLLSLEMLVKWYVYAVCRVSYVQRQVVPYWWCRTGGAVLASSGAVLVVPYCTPCDLTNSC